jgi:tetratricopeptide (TPR) repeat protein
LRGQQNFKGALRDLDAVLEIDPGFIEAVLQKAEVFHQMGDRKNSWKTLESAAKLDPTCPDIACFRGLLLKNQGDLSGALAALEQCLACFPGDRRALGQKGLVLMELGRLDEAVNCFNAVLQQGENADIAYRVASIYARKGLVRKAAQSLGKAAARDPQKLVAAKTDAAFDSVRETASFKRLFKKFHLI